MPMHVRACPAAGLVAAAQYWNCQLHTMPQHSTAERGTDGFPCPSLTPTCIPVNPVSCAEIMCAVCGLRSGLVQTDYERGSIEELVGLPQPVEKSIALGKTTYVPGKCTPPALCHGHAWTWPCCGLIYGMQVMWPSGWYACRDAWLCRTACTVASSSPTAHAYALAVPRCHCW